MSFKYGSQTARGKALIMKAKVDDSSELEETDTKKDGKLPMYSWLVLCIILAIRICYQWQRSIFSYTYGYKGIGSQMGNSVFEISAAFPELSQYFGLLTGFGYTIPFAVLGFAWGKWESKLNRKWVLGALCLAAAA